MITMNWTVIALNWTVLLKCLEMTFVVIWRYINKTELNRIELKRQGTPLTCNHANRGP